MKQRNITVERKPLPVAGLWTGAIMAPLVCAISIYDFILDFEKLGVIAIMWAIFIIGFSAFYSVVFARDLRERLQQQKGASK